jgi:hypothetical protein
MTATPLGKFLLERAPRPLLGILGQVFCYELQVVEKPTAALMNSRQRIVPCQMSRPKGRIVLACDARFGSEAEVAVIRLVELIVQPDAQHGLGEEDRILIC